VPAPDVTVVTPVHGDVGFLPRAVASLRAQAITTWELVVVDDGATRDVASALPADPRIRCVAHGGNRGLGAALNTGLQLAAADVVAYLPADDVWFPDHLSSLLPLLADGADLAWSGVRHHGRQVALDAPPGFGLQLVQVAHRRTGERWVERVVLESDDLHRLFWHRFDAAPTAATGRITCEWADHPAQRHKAIRESFDGGLNVFRRRYRVATPLRFHSSDSGEVDEPALYARFTEPPDLPREPDADALDVVLVGELAYNPERVLALSERGHRLAGLWTDDNLGSQTVGPLPFGRVEDIPAAGWHEALRARRPHVLYALLSWRAVPLAHAVLEADLGIPLVFHLKESPSRCIANGTWPLLADLVARADGVVLSSQEEHDWIALALPDAMDPSRTLVLDGDLPKANWLEAAPLPRWSADGAGIHTAVLGRPVGMEVEVVRRLAAADVHVHLFGQVRGRGPAAAWGDWSAQARAAAPDHVHVHRHVDQRGWVPTLSRFDAGWLHHVVSGNGGDLRRATWDDLNLPARIPPLLGSGVPLLQPASPGARMATLRLVEDWDVGIAFTGIDDLVERLRDEAASGRLRRNAVARRAEVTFDAHVDRLLGLFRAVRR
jgi:glycosyltransferase involved in cell wall biosynthesis